MRVGVYLVGLDPGYAGGVTTYAVGLLNGLLGCDRGQRVVAFVSDAFRPVLGERVPDATRLELVAVNPPPRSTMERLTRLPGLGGLHVPLRNWHMRHVAERLAANCDVVLFPLSFMDTYRLRVPSIVSFHDLQHEVYPEFFSWQELRARRVRYGATFRHATLMQASSLAMRDEALRIYRDLTPQRVAVIPEGVDFAEFSSAVAEDARSAYGLPEEFIFYPAQLWPHKNHLRLLQALERVGARTATRIPLVLTGADYSAASAIRTFITERGLSDQVFMLGRVPYAMLRSLYRQTSYVLSASLYESSCLPVLEAAATGAAMIVADIPPNRESARVFRLRLFDPLDIESMATTLSEAWSNRHANREAIAANRESARGYDWKVIAGMYIDQADRLLRTGSTSPQLHGV